MAILVDIDKYREMREAIREFSDPDYLQALFQAREEIRRGDGVPAEEVFRRKGL